MAEVPAGAALQAQLFSVVWCGVWVEMLAVPARCVRAMLFCGDPILFSCCLVACLGFFRPASISDGNKTTTGTRHDWAPGNSF